MTVPKFSKADVAAALREVGHQFIGRDFSDESLRAMDEAIGVVEDIIHSAPISERSTDVFLQEIPSEPPADGLPMDHFAACPVSGQENPLGLAAKIRREGNDVVASVVFGAACSGVPGVSHGGPVCAVLDDVMGFVFSTMNGKTGYTASMTVDFKAPVRIGLPTEFRGRLVRQEGRKLFIEAEAFDQDRVLLAQARALFLEVDFASVRSALHA